MYGLALIATLHSIVGCPCQRVKAVPYILCLFWTLDVHVGFPSEACPLAPCSSSPESTITSSSTTAGCRGIWRASLLQIRAPSCCTSTPWRACSRACPSPSAAAGMAWPSSTAPSSSRATSSGDLGCPDAQSCCCSAMTAACMLMAWLASASCLHAVHQAIRCAECWHLHDAKPRLRGSPSGGAARDSVG